jgi:hypothetical protein
MRLPCAVLQVSYHGGSSYPGQDTIGVMRGAKSEVESRMLLEEVVDEALRQVELRGWRQGEQARSPRAPASAPAVEEVAPAAATK